MQDFVISEEYILKLKLDRKSIQNLYFAFVRPLLEYGDIMWKN